MNSLPFILFGWVLFCGIITVTSFVVAAVFSARLTKHIKQHQYSKWRELSSIGQFGPGLSNPIRFWQYLQSEEPVEDEFLLRMKDKARIWWRYLLIWFLTYVFSLIAVAFVIVVFVVKK